MKKTLCFSLFLLIVCFIAHAQSEHYYYYQGEKIFLEVDPQYIFVTSHHQSEVTKSNRNSFKSSTEVQVDKTYTYLRKIKGEEKYTQDFFWKKVELSSISNTSYSKAIKALRQESPNLIVAPHFITQDAKKLGLSNYFYVKLKLIEDFDQLKAYASINGVELIGQNEYMPLWFTLSVTPNSPDAMQMANTFYESGLFSHAQPDIIMEKMLLSSPNDEYYNLQWGLQNTGQNNGTSGIDISVEQAWSIIDQSNIDLSTVKVAVIDDGVERPHEDMNIHSGYDAYVQSTGSGLYSTATGGVSTRGQHGTAVAGIIGAKRNNNLGVVGVAPGVTIYPISINDASFTPSRVIQLTRAINWAWNQGGVDVINCSWLTSPDQLLEQAINNAIANGRGGKGCVVVAGSGNLSQWAAQNNIHQTNISYPASLPNVLGVGAISPCGERKNANSCDGENWWGSDYGQELSVVAPGVDIITTDRASNNGYNTSSTNSPSKLNYGMFAGTSAATPFASGLAALILSVNPNLTANEVKSIIEITAQKVGNYAYNIDNPNGKWDDEMGYGLIDAHEAVFFADNMSSPVFLETIENICSTSPVKLRITNLSNVIWQTSSNLTIVTSTNHSVTVQRTSTRYSGSGWVRATLAGGQYVQQNIWVGLPSISIPPLPFFCPDQYNQINFPIVQGATSYKLSWSSSNIDFTDVFNNQWFSYPLNYLRFYGYEGDYIVTFQAKNDCGEIRTNHFEVRINAANAGCSGGGGPGPIIIRRAATQSEGDLTPESITPEGVTLYPNPAEDALNISMPHQLEVRNVYILNMNGQKLKTVAYTEQVDIKNLKPGMYVLQIETNTEIITKRFIRN